MNRPSEGSEDLVEIVEPNFSLAKYFIFLTLIFCSCQTHYVIETEIIHTPSAENINDLPSCFKPLLESEKGRDWAKELLIANTFAREMDFYRAITSYKRALIMIEIDNDTNPDTLAYRKKQMEFGIIQSYYLGQKYQACIDVFETSLLKESPNNFPALRELLIIVYDAYQLTNQCERSEYIWKLIENFDCDTAKKLKTSSALSKANFSTLNTLSDSSQGLCDLLHTYDKCKKSIKTAQTLNAVLPGAGYLYVGQRQTALTSFLINTLFIAAAYHFFSHGNPAAGIITTTLEVGWYVGGINGAGLAAKVYNEQLYHHSARNYMVQNSLFPFLMFECAF